MATDIAFAVGLLALGRGAGFAQLPGHQLALDLQSDDERAWRSDPGGREALLTIAIVDDIVAIPVIAVAYPATLSLGWLGAAAAELLAVVALRMAGVAVILVYVPLGVLVRMATLQSGVHATVAGVALGLLTPARPVPRRHVLAELEHRLHPVSTFLVIPLFALANAGVAVEGETLRDASASPPAWAIAFGLVVGKTLWISSAVLLALRLRIGVLPDGGGMRQVWGVAALGGIGFTGLSTTPSPCAPSRSRRTHRRPGGPARER